MQLDEWLFRKKITRKKLSIATGIGYQSIIHLLLQRRVITLTSALLIHRYTNGEVTMLDLCVPECEERYKKIVPYNAEDKEEHNVFSNI